MHDRHAIVGEQIADSGEEFGVVALSDMLEHADRDDAVEGALDLAIIAEMKPHARTKTAFLRARFAAMELLGAERHAGHIGICRPCQITGEPAPAGADIEDFKTGSIE